ncbi:hypothetical protein GOBAR_AA23616 [Gossypium barbadense]|uniref:PHD finger protein ALFIN-LIKE n=1 Tax=Gossypium barbadense TaxID=3634 RepID=A0A2P5X161_GOSBA|nr:hypothetical protein GOBAR_AA23616 [Gossypium barbadense]
MDAYNPRTVEEVFRDFKGRRAGMIKALTTDVGEFFQQCDPEKENLCLYGFPSEQWEVNLPAKELPPELPEPALGINFARDGVQERDWECLFNMINDLPTIFEVVTGAAKKHTKEKSSVSNHSSKKSKSNSKVLNDLRLFPPKSVCEFVRHRENRTATVLPGKPSTNYTENGYDHIRKLCKITPAGAEHIKQYKCPSCSGNKSARPS